MDEQLLIKPCSQELNGSIKEIDKDTVHKICSGQVIVTLAVAVKELIENSLDAGSTSIEIRLKNYGSESIEVIDNGSGVKEDNFKSLTLKHHTSKLSEFSDIISLNTFGFRGEALSSLCALSNVTIITCHKDATVGAKLEYDHGGNLIRQTPYPTQAGTTVLLKNIFQTLPVRHKEFTKNVKREFNRMITVLYGYCIISKNVRISVTNQVGDGKRNQILSTHGHESIKENVSSIFGTKQLCNLMEFEQHSPDDKVLEEYHLSKNDLNEQVFKINGFVSSCAHNVGRSANDRQFFYINGRPCDSTKLAKTVNEVYHSFNRHQYPLVVLDITLNKEAVDVNVTPDKRQVFVQNEKLLLALIKSSLLKMYENIPNTLEVQPASSFSKPVYLESELREKMLEMFSNDSIKNKQTSPKTVERKLNFKRTFAYEGVKTPESPKKGNRRKQIRLENFFSAEEQMDQYSENLKNDLREDSKISDCSSSDGNNSQIECSIHIGRTNIENYDSVDSEMCKNSFYEPKTNLTENDKDDELVLGNEKTLELHGSPLLNGVNENEEDNLKINPSVANLTSEFCFENEVQQERVKVDKSEEKYRKEIKIPFDTSLLKKKEKATDEHVLCRQFRAKITPQENKTAEEELKKQLRQEMFPKMKILGQFNLGFIITKLGSDLFIVDQHASDEKYNFEMLQKNTILENQKLVQPIPLELTVNNENILIENVDIFRKNGFDFEIDPNAVPMKRVKLISVPVSKNWMFGKDDVEELIFMLSDSPGILCRPSRITKMFASRACRKSVMIGSALNFKEMQKIINHMAEMEQPWNCPHGRPTLRHLIDLNLIKSCE